MKKLLFCFILSVFSLLLSAQKNYLPAGAEEFFAEPSPSSDIIELYEQTGQIAYKGKDCDDSRGKSIEAGKNGKEYYSSEWFKVKVQITNYKPASKALFDQAMQLSPPSKALADEESQLRSPSGNKDEISKTVTVSDAANGRMLLVKTVTKCVDSKNPSKTDIYISSYAVIGTAIVRITANYDSSDESIAKKLHTDIVEKIKSAGL